MERILGIVFIYLLNKYMANETRAYLTRAKQDRHARNKARILANRKEHKKFGGKFNNDGSKLIREPMRRRFYHPILHAKGQIDARTKCAVIIEGINRSGNLVAKLYSKNPKTKKTAQGFQEKQRRLRQLSLVGLA